MSKKTLIKVQPYSFHLIMRAIKKFEKENDAILVNNITLSNFLAEQSAMSKNSISIEVKIALLETYGYTDPDEELIKKMKDSKEIGDFEFSDMAFISLTAELNEIIKRHHPSAGNLTVSKVKNCDTVGDLVTLVEEIAYPKSI